MQNCNCHGNGHFAMEKENVFPWSKICIFDKYADSTLKQYFYY